MFFHYDYIFVKCCCCISVLADLITKAIAGSSKSIAFGLTGEFCSMKYI